MKQVIYIHLMFPVGNLALTYFQNGCIFCVLLKTFYSSAMKSDSDLDDSHL